MKTSFQRVFKDNHSYDANEIPFLDSLAYVVQKYLYTETTEEYKYDCRMDGSMKLFDFMTLCVHFISESVGDFGKATIKGYINDLRDGKRPYDRDVVQYPDGYLLVTNASYELIISLLWASYVYAKTRYLINKTVYWKEATKVFSDLIEENKAYKKEIFTTVPPYVFTDDAVKLLATRANATLIRMREEKKKSEPQPTNTQQNAEQEQTSLRAQVEELKATVQRLTEEKHDLELRLQSSQSATPWIACFDGFLHPSLNVEAVAEELASISSPHLPKKERGFWWVFFTVGTEIHWIPEPNNCKKEVLRWANLHFDCGWDWTKANQFKFTEINQKITSNPSSTWSRELTGNVIGDWYGELANTMKSRFVEIVDGGKLLDRSKFIKPGCMKVNNGRI